MSRKGLLLTAQDHKGVDDAADAAEENRQQQIDDEILARAFAEEHGQRGQEGMDGKMSRPLIVGWF